MKHKTFYLSSDDTYLIIDLLAKEKEKLKNSIFDLKKDQELAGRIMAGQLKQRVEHIIKLETKFKKVKYDLH